MPNYYAYLRVSRDTQDVANQQLGIFDYANDAKFSPLIKIEDTASRSLPWTKRQIGKLLQETAQPGDIVLASEFARLGGSPMQVFSIMQAAIERGITIIITKAKITLDASMQGQIQAAVFGMAAMIEVEFIRERTREGLRRAALEGRVGGRPKGSTGKLKLDAIKEQVGELHALEVSTPKLAKRFQVTEKTMRKFLARRFPKSAP